jgi:ABC-2 type transport system ATP-binding protein
MLEVKEISKRYGKKLALNNVSAQFMAGKINGLLGPNGAGKTTLIRIINQIIEPDKGGVYWNEKLCTPLFLEKVGYLPEERGMYTNMTVAHYLTFLGKLRGMDKFRIQQELSFWFEKFDIGDWRDKRIEELSKGMAQKIQFIATIFHDPELIIFDEPFSGFDPVNVRLIRREMRELKDKGKTILLSTHNMASVEELCDRAVLIHQGEVVKEGTIAALRNSGDTKVYAIQFTGNMIAFATALWAGFDLIDKKILDEHRFIVRVRLLGENTFKDLLHTLMPHIEIEGAWEEIPGMEDVFISATTETTKIEQP